MLERRRDELSFACVTLATIAGCLLPLWGDGWPMSHERLSSLIRTAIYADHLRHGDVFPIWASCTAWGMGTPLPLFYHKTFYYLSGPAFLATGALKPSMVTSLAVFMLAGAYGMRSTLRTFASRTAILLFVPQALLLARYTFTDWLVRGAVAEFAASMLLPWFLWWCLVLVTRRHLSWWIAPIFVLLFDAHSVIAYCALCSAAIAAGIFLAVERGRGVRATWRRGLLIGATISAVLAPQLAAMRLFLRDYDLSKITQAGYLATQHFLPAQQYVYDPAYTWLENWTGLTVALDPAISLALALGVVGLAACLLRDPRATLGWARRELAAPVPLFLLLSLLVFAGLLFRLSEPLYLHVPGLQYLQFPWRLMTFVTTLGILIVAYVLSRLDVMRSAGVASGVAVLWLAAFVAGSPLLHRFQYPFFTPAEIEAAISVKPAGVGRLLAGVGEYLPRVSRDGHELETTAVLDLYRELAHRGDAREPQGPCDVEPLPRASFDTLTVSYRVRCSAAAPLALPVSYNRYSEVFDNRDGGGRLPYTRRIDDPRIWIDIARPTQTIIEVRLPSVTRVARILAGR